MKNTPKIDWEIVVKKINGTVSKAEESSFNEWVNSSSENRKYYEDTIKYRKSVASGKLSSVDISAAKSCLNAKRKRKIFKSRFIKLSRYAALFIIPLAIGALLFNIVNKDTDTNKIAKIEPISNKAYLTLSSGERVYLSNKTKIDNITENDGTTIKKQDNEISYLGKNDTKTATSEILYNEIKIPRGGEYQMILSDGTKVWLNSASSLKFPVNFNSKTREVKLEGEAYFKVKKDASRPFIVKTSKGNIKVLGTSFNVFAYKNEEVSHTTLVEGKIEFSKDGNKKILAPGEQAISSGNKGNFQVRKVNTFLYTAWKDGLFVFEGESLESITNKLSLWYGVNFFFYNKEAKNYKLSGHMKRYEEFTDILKLIEGIIDVKFKIKGETITIYKAQKIN